MFSRFYGRCRIRSIDLYSRADQLDPDRLKAVPLDPDQLKAAALDPDQLKAGALDPVQA